MSYSIGIELFDYEGGKPLNILKYASLNDLIGKYLKLVIELRQAKDIPEKLSYETQCRYQWLDPENTEYTTKIVESGGASGVPLSRAPHFAYRAEHMIAIDDELISKMLENTLRFGVYGKVEQKRRKIDLMSLKIEEEEMEMQNGVNRDIVVETPSKQTFRDQSMSKNGMSAEEIELLRK